MHHLLLTATLLAAPLPAASVQDAELLRAVPPDAFVAVQVRDVSALLAKRETNAWVGFLTDPDWLAPLTRVLREAGASEGLLGDPEAFTLDLLEAASATRGAVFFGLPPGLEAGGGEEVALVVRGGPALAALLERGPGAGASALELEGYDAARAGEDGLVLASRGDLHVVAIAGSAADAAVVARRVLERIDGVTAPADAFAALALPAPDVTYAFNLAPLWGAARAEAEESPEAGRVIDALAGTDRMAGWLSLGVGERMEASFDVRLDPEGPLGDLSRLLGAADSGALGLAPADSVSTSVLALDVPALIELGLAIAELAQPGAGDAARGALDGVTLTVGIDVLGDLVPALTGQVINFRRSSADVDHQAFGLVSLVLDAGYGTYAVGVTEAEPFIDAVETLLDVTGTSDAVRSRTVRGPRGEAEVWTVEEDGLPFAFAITDRWVAVGFEPASLEGFLARALGAPDAPEGFLDVERNADAARAIGGAGGSITGTRSSIEAAVNTLAALRGMFALEEEPLGIPTDEDLEATARSLAARWFEGTVVSTFEVTPTAVRVRSIGR